MGDSHRLATGGCSGKLCLWDLRRPHTVEVEIPPYLDLNGAAKEENGEAACEQRYPIGWVKTQRFWRLLVPLFPLSLFLLHIFLDYTKSMFFPYPMFFLLPFSQGSSLSSHRLSLRPNFGNSPLLVWILHLLSVFLSSSLEIHFQAARGFLQMRDSYHPNHPSGHFSSAFPWFRDSLLPWPPGLPQNPPGGASIESVEAAPRGQHRAPGDAGGQPSDQQFVRQPRWAAHSLWTWLRREGMGREWLGWMANCFWQRIRYLSEVFGCSKISWIFMAIRMGAILRLIFFYGNFNR